jgi:GNAT superfamily N-acetyltransferase
MGIAPNMARGGKESYPMEFVIRPASRNDAEAISQVIITALRETNAKDYSAAVIARVEQSFSPTSISELMAQRLIFVATNQDGIVGRASLDGCIARTVFVDPKYHGLGIGRALMAAVEQIAAEPFYAKLGFTSVRDSYHGEERTIVMELRLAGSQKSHEGSTSD